MASERITSAEVDRIELEQQFETARQTSAHRDELSLSSLRTAFLINGGGLVGLYTVLGHVLDKGISISRNGLWCSAALMMLGLLFAALGQLGYYRSWDEFSRAHFGAARNIIANHRGEPDVVDARQVRKKARNQRSFSRAFVLISILLFGVGAVVALGAVSAALPKM